METNIIKLDNNYYLEVIEDSKKIKQQSKDIKKLSLFNILDKEKLLLKIDFNNIDTKQYKKILRKLLIIKKHIHKARIGIEKSSKILLGYVINYNKSNKKHQDFILAINAIFYKTRFERYNYIYDTVCNYLDSCFYGKNLCDFKDNKCGEKRNTSSVIGCCRHYKIKLIGPFSKLVPCEYLEKDYTCGAKCIACKLFTCNYLEKKGIKFKINEILLLDVFFNPMQKYFIKYMVYTTKEKIIKRLMII